MLRLRLRLAILGVLTSFALASADEKPTLSADDKKLLDGMLKDFLFDPTGAERVTFKRSVRTVSGAVFPRETPDAEGWFVPGKGKELGRIYFTDGASIPAPPVNEMTKVDFVAACKARYSAAPEPKEATEEEITLMRANFRKAAAGAYHERDVAIAAWLYRLGKSDLAVKALTDVRARRGPSAESLRDHLAWTAFEGLICAYMVRADDEAMAEGERLFRLYPDEAKKYPQADRVIAELKRRKAIGTFAKTPPEEWPVSFQKWDAKKKTAYLIANLDEVDARQHGQPGGVDYLWDRRILALVEVGDAGVPALLDAAEKDKRLTRSIQYWRDFSRDRKIQPVRIAALAALSAIVQVDELEPVPVEPKTLVEDAEMSPIRQLRAYWRRYGHLPFDERMMNILTDPKTTFPAKREAARNLGALGTGRLYHDGGSITPAREKWQPNPAVAKFSKPTVAEAMVAAMDAELVAHDDAAARNPVGRPGFSEERQKIEETYLEPLTELGDNRLGRDAAERANAAGPLRLRLSWSRVAARFGEPGAFRQFADEFREGKLPVPANRDEAASELAGILRTFDAVGSPEADRAWASLGNPKHPFHDTFTGRILDFPSRCEGNIWFAHPVCLPILRKMLDDPAGTGAVWSIKGGYVRRDARGSSMTQSLPDFLRDPNERIDETAERACDAAALKLGEMIAGLPEYHPLLKDSKKRRKEVEGAFDRYAGKFRPATREEARVLGLDSDRAAYLPDFKPLGRAATADDVKVGKAVFHLDGKGKPADVKLPQVVVLKGDEKKEYPSAGLVVQAEVGADGAITCGIVFRHAIRAVSAKAVGDIKPVEQWLKDEAEKRRQK